MLNFRYLNVTPHTHTLTDLFLVETSLSLHEQHHHMSETWWKRLVQTCSMYSHFFSNRQEEEDAYSERMFYRQMLRALFSKLFPVEYMAGSVLIWAPPGRGRRVPGTRNGPFWPPKNPAACFGGRRKPLREWPHAIPRFSIETGLFSRRKTQGRVLGPKKAPAGSTRTHTLVLGKDRSRTRPLQGGLVSNLASPGCVVRVPAHWAI